MPRILLIFFISYLIYRWLIKPLLKPRGKGSFSYRDNTNRHQQKEGDVNMSGKPQNNKKVFDKSEGDYVDYEEVD